MLYKIETSSCIAPLVYIKAESIEDALFKARKYYEGIDSLFAKDIYKKIRKVELVSYLIIE
jgi:hypothetical protein